VAKDLEFRVLKEGARFVIRDQNDLSYGSYSSKQEAEQNKQAWIEYLFRKKFLTFKNLCSTLIRVKRGSE
jgi:hypothetical protein